MSVTYFKLDYRKHGYPGDTTKGCALTGCEIDDNFHFLRGNDIETISFDDDKQELTFIRVDESKIVVPINVDINGYVFDFDKNKGKLIITYPNGETKELNVFIPVEIYSDDTLTGKGTANKPLGISNLYKTGMYKPVQEYVEELPESPLAGYRAISKETIDTYGRLYTYEDVLKIDKELKENGSPWRIPTKDDWDKMLNSIELCDDDRNHDSKGIGDFGKNAGEFLKIKGEIWEDTKGAESSDIYGFSVIPVGRRSANGGYETKTYHHHTYFWTMSDAENNDIEVYTKAFRSDSGKVSQKRIEKTCSCSLRLVRDYNNEPVGEIEDIMGISVPCVLMPSSQQVWTKVNVSFSVADGQEIGNILKVWLEDQEYYHPKKTFFINEYEQDESWIKKELLLGDSVVIAENFDIEGKPVKWHEWRVLKNEEGEYILVDTVEIIKHEIIDVIHQLEELLNKEIEDRKAGDEELSQKIDGETSRAQGVEQALGTRIDSIEIDYKEADIALGNRIEEERIRATQAENGLANRINTEVQRATGVENELSVKIQEETERAKSEEQRLEEEIESASGEAKRLVAEERERAISAETELGNTISEEIKRAEGVEEELQGAINTEVNRAKNIESGLQNAIDNEATTARAAEKANADAIAAEETRATTAEEILTTNLAGEIERATSKETELNTAIVNEVNRAKQAEEANTLAIQNETERAKESEKIIQEALDAEIALRNSEYEGWKIVALEPEEKKYAISYELQDKDGNTRGARINLIKDKFIKDVSFNKYTWTDEGGNVHTNEYALRFTFFVGEEETKVVYVAVDDFLKNEFGRGLEIIEGKVCVKLNNTVEDKYLKLTEEGLYTEGISKAITDGDKVLNDKITEVIGGVLVDGYRTLHEIGHTVPTKLGELNATIESETTRATGAENSLNEKIGGEITRAKEAEQVITSTINNEAERAVVAESSLNTAIINETERATTAETELINKLEDETRRADVAEKANAKAISDEIVRATGVENDLNTAITNEVERATTAEAILEGKIGTSKEEVSGLITAEHDRAVSAETELDDRLSVVESDYLKTPDKDELTTKIDNEVTQRTEEYIGWKIVEITPESPKFAVSYELRDKDNNKRGASINILKDKFIKEVKFGKFTWEDEDGNIHTDEYALRFTFYIGEGETKVVYVTVDDFLKNEFGKGLEIVDGKVQVKLNTTVEDKYLKVTDEGIYTEGIGKAIADGDKALGDEIRNEVKGGALVDGYKTLHEIGHTVPTKLDELNTAVQTEATRATEAEDVLRTSISEETQTRTERDNELQANINAEINARVEKDNELQTKIDTETSERETKDNEIFTLLATEEEERKIAVNELDQKIENEKTAREAGDEDLQGKIDSLTQQVSVLERENQELKERLDELEAGFENRIKAIISETVLGVQNQIKVTPEFSPADKAKLIDIRIGFDDTAQFIANNN